MVHDDLFLLIFRYLGVSLRTKAFALYKRVQDMTMTDDEGDIAKLDPTYPLLQELKNISPISISPVVFQDERRQHLVRIMNNPNSALVISIMSRFAIFSAGQSPMDKLVLFCG